MIKLQGIAEKLQLLLEKARTSEKNYRSAMTCATDSNEKVLYIYFWQEHARMVAELEERIRSLRGNAGLPESPWGNVLFTAIGNPEDAMESVRACQAADWSLLSDYEYALKQSLPVDVSNLLRRHVLKIKNIQARMLERLVSRISLSQGLAAAR